MKDKKGVNIVNAFQKSFNSSNRKPNRKPNKKPNKIWADQGSEFYKTSFKDFLTINSIEMYSPYNEGKSVAAERFIRTLKNKIFKHMTAVSKNVYFDVLDDTVNKYNNTVNRTIKMKPIDLTDHSCAEYNEDFNKKIVNLKLLTMLEIQNTKTFLLKDMPQFGRKKFLLLVGLKIQFRGLMLFVI